jgi:hypothetical protein
MSLMTRAMPLDSSTDIVKSSTPEPFFSEYSPPSTFGHSMSRSSFSDAQRILRVDIFSKNFFAAVTLPLQLARVI